MLSSSTAKLTSSLSTQNISEISSIPKESVSSPPVDKIKKIKPTVVATSFTEIDFDNYSMMVPENLCCSLSLYPMLIPVLARDGKNYDLRMIASALERKGTSPMNPDINLKNSAMIFNQPLRSQIQEFFIKHLQENEAELKSREHSAALLQINEYIEGLAMEDEVVVKSLKICKEKISVEVLGLKGVIREKRPVRNKILSEEKKDININPVIGNGATRLTSNDYVVEIIPLRNNNEASDEAKATARGGRINRRREYPYISQVLDAMLAGSLAMVFMVDLTPQDLYLWDLLLIAPIEGFIASTFTLWIKPFLSLCLYCCCSPCLSPDSDFGFVAMGTLYMVLSPLFAVAYRSFLYIDDTPTWAPIVIGLSTNVGTQCIVKACDCISSMWNSSRRQQETTAISELSEQEGAADMISSLLAPRTAS